MPIIKLSGGSSLLYSTLESVLNIVIIVLVKYKVFKIVEIIKTIMVNTICHVGLSNTDVAIINFEIKPIVSGKPIIDKASNVKAMAEKA